MMLFKLFGAVALLFFAYAQYWALVRAPADYQMGDVYRILFVHVPAAWNALLLLTFSFVASLMTLLKRSATWDRLAHSSIEVGVLLTGLALALGSIWGRPTWGVWWTWDPRLTTTAILFILYLGYLMLRRLIEDRERRSRITASVSILIYLNVPIVYFSVKWWRTLHQVQSNPNTMDPAMVTGLRLNALALLALSLFFLIFRYRLAKREQINQEKEDSK
ncbi:MAG: cytochrome c biogenesis protein CcsA [Deltaproteobacteria bacterium]|nr:cytochrome c biogenesis protein CcsA [Deltaproteobacteria bacterium]